MSRALAIYGRSTIECARAYGLRMPAIMASAAYARLRYKIGPTEFFMFCMHYDKLSAYGDYRLFYDGPSQAIKRLNTGSTQPDNFRDKLAASRTMVECGVPIAPIAAVVTGADTDVGPFRALTSAADVAAFFGSADCPDDLFVKPSSAFGGAGACSFKRISGRWTLEGADTDPEAIAARLWADHTDDLLIQPRLTTHSAFDDLGGAFGLSSLRVVTLLTNEGPMVLGIIHKLLRTPGLVDNFLAGRSGVMLAYADPETGIYGPLYGKPDGFKHVFVEMPVHPVTGGRLEGRTLPMLEEVKAAACAAAAAYDSSPLLGSDIALTDDGAYVLESNLHPSMDLYQTATIGGVAAALRPHFDKLDVPADAIAEAKALFRL